MRTERRWFLKTMGLAGAGVVLSPMISVGCGHPRQVAGSSPAAPSDPFVLEPLGYAYSALEPIIDATTMEIHHSKHHAAYVKNLNQAVIGNGTYEGRDLLQIFSLLRDGDSAIRNNAGGHWNHTQFWRWIKPGGASGPGSELASAIDRSFGSFDQFKVLFSDAAKSRFGSGWAWLCVGADRRLFITSSPNQDNPLMVNIAPQYGQPVLGVDVWEHAYYLKYQNRRPEYIDGFFKIINWDEVGLDFARAMK